MIEALSKDLDKIMYLLYHLYEYGENNEKEECKILGIYSSEKTAYEAIERYYKLDGFKRYPKECFIVDKYKVDIDTDWKEGFVNSVDLEHDFENLTIIFNEWLGNNKNPQESWENERYYNALCDVNNAKYKIDDAKELAECIEQIWINRLKDKTISFNEYLKIATSIKQIL